jgi:hypothetical protein
MILYISVLTLQIFHVHYGYKAKVGGWCPVDFKRTESIVIRA